MEKKKTSVKAGRFEGNSFATRNYELWEGKIRTQGEKSLIVQPQSYGATESTDDP